MHQADAQHRAGAGQPRVRERSSVIGVENLREAASGDRPAQQVLAGPGVLAGEEPAVDQQPRVIIDDEEQPGAHRALPAGPGHPGADEHVGDPPLVRPRGLIPAVGLRLGGERLAVQAGAAQLAADGPVGDLHAVPVVQDRGDLHGRASRQLQPQRGRLGEQLRVGAHRAGVGPRRGPQRLQPPGSPLPQPAVDRAPGVTPGRPVRVGVGARGYLADHRAPLRRCQRAAGRLGDHRPAVQRHLLLLPAIHCPASSRR